MTFVVPEDASGATVGVSTPTTGGAGDAAAVNKKELAAILGCSPQTLSAWVDRFGEAFPVIDRGTNGKEWRFDPPAVIAFLQSKHDAEAREAAERAAWLQQYALPGLTSPDDVEGVTKPSDLLALAKVRQIHRREQMEAGLLVPTSERARCNGQRCDATESLFPKHFHATCAQAWLVGCGAARRARHGPRSPTGFRA